MVSPVGDETDSHQVLSLLVFLPIAYASVWRSALFEFLPMPESSPPPTLLDRLDQEQDDVIRQLDALNSRIEEVLKQFGGDHEPSKTAAAA